MKIAEMQAKKAKEEKEKRDKEESKRLLLQSRVRKVEKTHSKNMAKGSKARHMKFD